MQFGPSADENTWQVYFSGLFGDGPALGYDVQPETHMALGIIDYTLLPADQSNKRAILIEIKTFTKDEKEGYDSWKGDYAEVLRPLATGAFSLCSMVSFMR